MTVTTAHAACPDNSPTVSQLFTAFHIESRHLPQTAQLHGSDGFTTLSYSLHLT